MRQMMVPKIDVVIISTIEQFQVEAIWREMYFITHCQIVIWILKSYYHYVIVGAVVGDFLVGPLRTIVGHSIVAGLELQPGGVLMYSGRIGSLYPKYLPPPLCKFSGYFRIKLEIESS